MALAYDESVFAKAEQKNLQRTENRLKAQAQALGYKQTKAFSWPFSLITGRESDGATLSMAGGFCPAAANPSMKAEVDIYTPQIRRFRC